MEPRKISIKLKRDPRETAERHSQANPLTLECTLASGEAVTETMELRAELHAAQTPATTPLAATAAVTMTAGSTGPWLLEFTGAQMNQTVLPDSSADFWLPVYATNADDDLFVLGKMALTLVFDNVSQTTPPPPAPALFLDLGGTQWKIGEDYVVDDIVALDGSIYVCVADNTSAAGDEPGVGAEWESFWVLFSGGGGGTVNLTSSRTANDVTITPSGGGTAAEIPQANATHAGVMTAEQHSKLDGLPTGDAFGELAFQDTIGATDIDTGAVTEAKIADGAVTANKIGTGAVGPTQLASTTVTPGSYTLLSATIDSDGRITAASNGSGGGGGGTNTIFRALPQDASFPATAFATRDTRNNHPCLDFDSGTPETAYFIYYIPQGASFASSGTALTFKILSTAASATSGVIGWGICLERLVANGIDIDSDSFGTEQTGSATVNATSGKSSGVTITFTLAQLPSGIAAGDQIRIKLTRNTSVGSNHTGDAEFLGLYADMTPEIP